MKTFKPSFLLLMFAFSSSFISFAIEFHGKYKVIGCCSSEKQILKAQKFEKLGELLKNTESFLTNAENSFEEKKQFLLKISNFLDSGVYFQRRIRVKFKSLLYQRYPRLDIDIELKSLIKIYGLVLDE